MMTRRPALTSRHNDVDRHRAAEDADLIARARAGERTALEAIYRVHHEPVLRFARSLAGGDLAEDLVAEAFARTFDKLLDGEGPDHSLRGYLMTAARNLRIGVVRKDHRLLLADDLTFCEPEPTGTDPWTERWDAELIQAAFGRLTERDRTVLWWTSVEGRPAEELAATWSTSPQAVRQHAFRAREALRLAYLAVHLAGTEEAGCQETRSLLPRRARGHLAADSPRGRRVEHHLTSCVPCTTAGEEIRDTADRLRVRVRARPS
jgi:RNA polymerase sigma factor (sigma-70 family)